MKAITGLLVGLAVLASCAADAQYYPQASVSGYVLSEGPLGFMLQGPDGKYGIAVAPTTVFSNPWNTVAMTGPGNIVPGEFVTATGYPTSQWIMQATQVVVGNTGAQIVYPPYGPVVYQPYGNSYAPYLVP